MSILFVQGVNDRGKAHVGLGPNGQPRLNLDGSCNALAMINFQGIVTRSVMLFGKNVRQPPVRLPERPSLIFNEISDADTHTAALSRCMTLCRHAEVPVINPPENVMRTTRDQVSEMLQGIPGLDMPRTIRFHAEAPAEVVLTAQAVGMDFPLIVRIAGDHGGKSMVRLRGPGDVDKLEVFPFDDTAFYLTEFVDYRDGDGSYLKQRIVVVGGEPIARHAIVDKRWNVHASSRNEEAGQVGGNGELERTLVLRDDLIPKVRRALDAITERLELDYFGIDCHIDRDGRMLVFEANANMNMLYNKVPELDPRVDRVKDRLCAMLSARSGESVSWAGEPAL